MTVAIVGISNHAGKVRKLFAPVEDGGAEVKETDNINAYLVAAPNVVIRKASKPLGAMADMSFGNKPVDGGNLLLTSDEVEALSLTRAQRDRFIRRIYGSAEFIQGKTRYCLWIEDDHLQEALSIPGIDTRIDGVRAMRLASRDKGANAMANRAHQMREMNSADEHAIVVPRVSSENREYLPIGLVPERSLVADSAFALYDAPLWNMALIASRLHLVWVATVCGKLETRYRYSNTLGWNTFPVPMLTEKNRTDLTTRAEDILLAREAHFPATIADLYDPQKCPKVCATPTTATTKRLNASISAAASSTMPNGWKTVRDVYGDDGGGGALTFGWDAGKSLANPG